MHCYCLVKQGMYWTLYKVFIMILSRKYKGSLFRGGTFSDEKLLSNTKEKYFGNIKKIVVLQ